MKTFIISLKKATDRRKFMVEQAERLKLDYELMDAVDGFSLSEEYKREVCDVEHVKKLYWWGDGSLGCSLSHYNAYKRILELDLDYGFILEDDSVLPDDVSDILNSISKAIEKNELVLLHYRCIRQTSLSLKGSRDVGKYKLLYPVNPRGPIAGSAYIVTREAARGMVNIIMPIRMGADMWGYFYDEGAIESISCVYPMPAKVANFRTTMNFLGKDSLITKIVNFIYKYRIPILYNILNKRRERNLNTRTTNFVLTEDVSPIQKKLIQNLR